MLFIDPKWPVLSQIFETIFWLYIWLAKKMFFFLNKDCITWMSVCAHKCVDSKFLINSWRELIKTGDYRCLSLPWKCNSLTALDHTAGGVTALTVDLHFGKPWQQSSYLRPEGGNTILDFSHCGRSPNPLPPGSLKGACWDALLTPSCSLFCPGLCQLILPCRLQVALVWLLHRCPIWDECIPLSLRAVVFQLWWLGNIIRNTVYIMTLYSHVCVCTYFTRPYTSLWQWCTPFSIPFYTNNLLLSALEKQCVHPAF